MEQPALPLSHLDYQQQRIIYTDLCCLSLSLFLSLRAKQTKPFRFQMENGKTRTGLLAEAIQSGFRLCKIKSETKENARSLSPKWNRLNRHGWGSFKVVSISTPRTILRGRVNNIFGEGTHGVYYGSGSTDRSIKASLLTAASGRATQLYWQHCSVDTECTPGLNPKSSGLSFSLQISNYSTLKPLTMDFYISLVTTRCNRTKNNAENLCGHYTAPFKPDFDVTLTLTSAGLHQIKIYLCLILASAAQTVFIPS